MGKCANKKGRITAKRVQATENDPAPVVADADVKPEADEDGWDDEGLTVRQRLFVDALLGPAGGNPVKAARMAGYSDSNTNVLRATAARLLTFVNVRSAVARRFAQFSLTPDWLRRQVAALADSNMGNFLTIGTDGEPRMDWQQAHDRGAFVQIREYREKGLKAGGTVEVIERSVKTHNPAPFLQLMARLMGLVSDDKGGDGRSVVNVYQLSEDELVRIATGGGKGTAPHPPGAPVPDRLRQRD